MDEAILLKDLLLVIAEILGAATVVFGGMFAVYRWILKQNKQDVEIKALNEERLSYLIVTKSDIVASDEYIKILDKDLAHIQITVTTTDDNLSLTYENLKK